MHIHAPYDISVANKATTPTGPIPAFRLLLPATLRTLAAGSSLTATEALNADLCTLLLQILLIFAVLPLRHSLVVMASFVVLANPMRVAHIERLHPFGSAETDCLAGALVPQIAHSPLLFPAFPLACIQQTPPAFAAFLAACLQTRELPKHLVVLPFDAAHPAPGHDQGFACVRGDGCLMNFSQIDGGLNFLPRSCPRWDWWGRGSSR
jgi:hypothetical protein